MALGMVIFSVAMAANQYSSSRDVARSQEKLARQNAMMIEEETQESARRMSEQQESQEASARARAAASGVDMSGSVLGSLERLSSENRQQLEWLKKAGASRSRIAKDQGYLEADITRNEGLSSAFGSLGSAYGYGEGKYW